MSGYEHEGGTLRFDSVWPAHDQFAGGAHYLDVDEDYDDDDDDDYDPDEDSDEEEDSDEDEDYEGLIDENMAGGRGTDVKHADVKIGCSSKLLTRKGKPTPEVARLAASWFLTIVSINGESFEGQRKHFGAPPSYETDKYRGAPEEGHIVLKFGEDDWHNPGSLFGFLDELIKSELWDELKWENIDRLKIDRQRDTLFLSFTKQGEFGPDQLLSLWKPSERPKWLFEPPFTKSPYSSSSEDNSEYEE